MNDENALVLWNPPRKEGEARDKEGKMNDENALVLWNPPQKKGETCDKEDKMNDEKALVLWNTAKTAGPKKLIPPTSLPIPPCIDVLTDWQEERLKRHTPSLSSRSVL